MTNFNKESSNDSNDIVVSYDDFHFLSRTLEQSKKMEEKDELFINCICNSGKKLCKNIKPLHIILTTFFFISTKSSVVAKEISQELIISPVEENNLIKIFEKNSIERQALFDILSNNIYQTDKRDFFFLLQNSAKKDFDLVPKLTNSLFRLENSYGYLKNTANSYFKSKKRNNDIVFFPTILILRAGANYIFNKRNIKQKDAIEFKGNERDLKSTSIITKERIVGLVLTAIMFYLTYEIACEIKLISELADFKSNERIKLAYSLGKKVTRKSIKEYIGRIVFDLLFDPDFDGIA
jgi:hypothetical protein